MEASAHQTEGVTGSWLQDFTPTDLKDNPLPVVVTRGKVAQHEAVGQGIQWAFEYLYNRACPDPLINPALKSVCCALSSGEKAEDQDQDLDELQLMHSVVGEVDKHLLRIRNEADVVDGASASLAEQKTDDNVRHTSFDVSYFAMKNHRRTMEDKLVVLPTFSDIFELPKELAYFAIFDGHSGVEAASYASAQLHHHLAKLLKKNWAEGIDQFPETVNLAFAQTDVSFMRKCEKNNLKNSGTTAVTVLVSENKIYLAWIGDSQATLHYGSGKVKQLVTPHRPDDPLEKERILKLGGEVMEMGGMPRVNGMLAVTRSIGDSNCKECVVANPTVRIIERSPDLAEEYIVLASDGLWDNMKPVQVGDFVNSLILQGKPNEAAQLLAKEAKEKGSQDNISVIVVYLQKISQLADHINQRGNQTVETEDVLGTQVDMFKYPVVIEVENGVDGDITEEVENLENGVAGEINAVEEVTTFTTAQPKENGPSEVDLTTQSEEVVAQSEEQKGDDHQGGNQTVATADLLGIEQEDIRDPIVNKEVRAEISVSQEFMTFATSEPKDNGTSEMIPTQPPPAVVSAENEEENQEKVVDPVYHGGKQTVETADLLGIEEDIHHPMATEVENDEDDDGEISAGEEFITYTPAQPRETGPSETVPTLPEGASVQIEEKKSSSKGKVMAKSPAGKPLSKGMVNGGLGMGASRLKTTATVVTAHGTAASTVTKSSIRKPEVTAGAGGTKGPTASRLKTTGTVATANVKPTTATTLRKSPIRKPEVTGASKGVPAAKTNTNAAANSALSAAKAIANGTLPKSQRQPISLRTGVGAGAAPAVHAAQVKKPQTSIVHKPMVNGTGTTDASKRPITAPASKSASNAPKVPATGTSRPLGTRVPPAMSTRTAPASAAVKPTSPGKVPSTTTTAINAGIKATVPPTKVRVPPTSTATSGRRPAPLPGARPATQRPVTQRPATARPAPKATGSTIGMKKATDSKTAMKKDTESAQLKPHAPVSKPISRGGISNQGKKVEEPAVPDPVKKDSEHPEVPAVIEEGKVPVVLEESKVAPVLEEGGPSPQKTNHEVEESEGETTLTAPPQTDF